MTKLSVHDLSVSTGSLPIVQGLNFTLENGERVGLIGESGSGKSLTALAILDLLPAGLSSDGEVRIGDDDLLALSRRQRARMRGSRIAMVFQEPMTALNPTMRVGMQVAESLRIHRGLGKRDAWTKAVELLAKVELPQPETQASKYPHQLSGGQRQRVVLAIALACDPEVLLADEPTTALDVTVQAQMIALMSRLVTENNAALLLISHDIALVSSVCDRIFVMYGGRIVESGPTEQILNAPRHPYTVGLLRISSTLSVDRRRVERDLPLIRGTVPPSGGFGPGCPFASRCDFATGACDEMPPMVDHATRHHYACWHPVAACESITSRGARNE
jgi:peptide/nickel transport system ATP-binding protein